VPKRIWKADKHIYVARWVVTKQIGLNLRCKVVKRQEALDLGTG